MGRFAWDFGHSGTPDKRQSGGDTLRIFLVGRQVGFQELVFNPSSLMDDPREANGRDEGNERADGKGACGNRNQHGEIAGMPHESVRARCNDAMTGFGLNPYYGGEERIDNHCPGLERSAESKCKQRCSTQRSWHVEKRVESTHGQGSDSHGHKEQETRREAQSIIGSFPP